MVKIKVEVGNVDGTCFHSMKEGNYFIIDDYELKIPDGNHVRIWALNRLMPISPLFIEKDRLGEHHWVKDAKSMRCPDGKVSYFFTKFD